MDILAHTLWSYIMFMDSKYVLLAVFFGVLPDILPFTFEALRLIYTKEFRKLDPKDPETLKHVPRYVFFLYNLSHSLVVFLVIFIIVFHTHKGFSVVLMPWLFHILFDIPTHEKEFFPTKFLYPISNYYISGFRWDKLWFIVLNYALIFVFYIIRIIGIM